MDEIATALYEWAHGESDGSAKLYPLSFLLSLQKELEGTDAEEIKKELVTSLKKILTTSQIELLDPERQLDRYELRDLRKLLKPYGWGSYIIYEKGSYIFRKEGGGDNISEVIGKYFDKMDIGYLSIEAGGE